MTDLPGQDEENRRGPARGTVIAIAITVAAVVVIAVFFVWLITSMGGGSPATGGLY